MPAIKSDTFWNPKYYVEIQKKRLKQEGERVDSLYEEMHAPLCKEEMELCGLSITRA